MSSLDPLGGRALPTGIVSTLPLQGQAKAVTLEGSTTNAEMQTAYVATGTHGLAIVDASNFQRPLVLSQLDLTGDAVDIAVDSRLGIAAVAAGSALHLVDVSDATAPVRTQTINIPAVQVEVANGVAYVAAGNGIESYSLLTGELLQVLPIGSSAIVSLARDGSLLYAVDASSTLRAIDISGLTMRGRGTLALPAAAGKVFVGNGIAYIGASSSPIGGFTAGFTTADAADPDSMHVLSGPDMFNLQGYAVAANGSGLGLLAGSLAGAAGRLSRIDVVDVRDPTRTDQFLTSFDVSVPPFDLAIGAGIAFVADGTGGLQVVNYLPFDNRGEAPTIALSAPTTDLDPATPSIQALEGSPINVKLDVADDQQVRNVELLVDGKVVANDVSFPWNTSIPIPLRTADKTNTVVQARATDTGGNTTLSDALVIELVPDTFAPTIVSSNVADGSRHGQLFRTVRLQFSEAMDPATLDPANFQLRDAAGTLLAPVDVAVDTQGVVVQLTFPALTVGDYSLLIQADQVRDRAGNALGAAQAIFGNFSITASTIEWVGHDGDWNNPGNWDAGRLPDALDDVLIAGPVAVPIILRGGDTRVHSLVVTEDFTPSGGTLTVDDSITAEGHFTLNGGTISRAKLTLKNQPMEVAYGTRSSRLDGVTVVGDINLSNATLRLKDVAIDGRVTLAHGSEPYGGSTLAFEGTQTLGGHAEIVSDGVVGYYYNALEMQTAGELTLGAGVRVRGAGLNLGGSNIFGVPMQRLINLGVIQADTSGAALQVVAQSFTNEGVVRASGGTLNLYSASTSNESGGQFQVTNGTLNVGGHWHSEGGVNISGGTLNLGGIFDTTDLGGLVSTGGTVTITGSADNVGRTLSLAATPGSWELTNGTIHGGTLQIAPGTSLVVTSGTRASRLDGVTVVGDIELPSSTLRLNDVTINGRVTLASGYGYFSTLAFEGTQTLRGHAEIVSTRVGSYYDIIEMQTAGELTLGADVRVRGARLELGGSYAFSAPMTRLINLGVIEAEVTGGAPLQVVAQSFANEGVVRASGGTLNLYAGSTSNEAGGQFQVTSGMLNVGGSTFTNAGALKVTGGSTAIGATTWSSPGSIAINAGALALGGSFALADFATFDHIGGTVTITGSVDNVGRTLSLRTAAQNRTVPRP